MHRVMPSLSRHAAQKTRHVLRRDVAAWLRAVLVCRAHAVLAFCATAQRHDVVRAITPGGPATLQVT